MVRENLAQIFLTHLGQTQTVVVPVDDPHPATRWLVISRCGAQGG